MCCRYCILPGIETEIFRITEHRGKLDGIRYGDIYPSDPAPVIMELNDQLSASIMNWGYPSFQSGQLMINARAETVKEKSSFRNGIQYRRCVIPAAHFYEWNILKEKVTFTYPISTLIYMAGIYDCFDEKDRFVILTTEANASMTPVHDRMPLILKEQDALSWILDERKTDDFLSSIPPMLTRYQEYEQQRLPL